MGKRTAIQPATAYAASAQGRHGTEPGSGLRGYGEEDPGGSSDLQSNDPMNLWSAVVLELDSLHCGLTSPPSRYSPKPHTL